MDIKSVIKTFAEAWAAASLRLDPGAGVSLPRPPHTWRPPSPAALGKVHIYSSLKNKVMVSNVYLLIYSKVKFHLRA